MVFYQNTQGITRSFSSECAEKHKTQDFFYGYSQNINNNPRRKTRKRRRWHDPAALLHLSSLVFRGSIIRGSFSAIEGDHRELFLQTAVI
ncbi:MAG: hypothetical protein K5697_14285, partial [Lachnospiraceae bacterium]|nr:hypothetical protein [Lachnospiraceae bacterium]